ncbi:MAG TPA: 2-hydroxychromene-2-carboxylate isomerase [Rhodocyclaceae bacterium]
MPPPIEFWFDYSSNYSYLSVMRIDDAAARSGVTVQWKPFLLGPIFRSFGMAGPSALVRPPMAEYIWKDIARQAAKYLLPLARPSTFPRSAVLPLRVALLGAEQPWISEFSKRIMLLNFARDMAIDDSAVVSQVLHDLGLPAAEIIEQATTAANKLALREQTEAARLRGIFGAPTFFVGEEMFWGNDRLDDALEFAAFTALRHEAS